MLQQSSLVLFTFRQMAPLYEIALLSLVLMSINVSPANQKCMSYLQNFSLFRIFFNTPTVVRHICLCLQIMYRVVQKRGQCFCIHWALTYAKQEAQLLLGWPTVLPYSRRLCKSCGAFMQIGPAVFS